MAAHQVELGMQVEAIAAQVKQLKERFATLENQRSS
jgi:hypothetical protein